MTGAQLAGASISGTTLTISATTGVAARIFLSRVWRASPTQPRWPYHRLAHFLVACRTGCTLLTAWNSDLQQTVKISASQTVAAETMRADPAGGTYGLPAAAAFPTNPLQQLNALYPFASGIGGAQPS